jgi:hypothetical protein
MPTNPDIFTADGTTKGTAQGFIVCNGDATIPTHGLIIVQKALITQADKERVNYPHLRGMYKPVKKP